jgi:hypothetical protein
MTQTITDRIHRLADQAGGTVKFARLVDAIPGSGEARVDHDADHRMLSYTVVAVWQRQ